jgi:hypothetical protein
MEESSTFAGKGEHGVQHLAARPIVFLGVVIGAADDMVAIQQTRRDGDVGWGPRGGEVVLRADRPALAAAETADFLDGFLALSQRVPVRQRLRPSIQDPADDMFVEALVSGGGSANVTFNRRDYLSADHRLASQRVTVVPTMSPGKALRSLAWRPTATTPFAFPRR